MKSKTAIRAAKQAENERRQAMSAADVKQAKAEAADKRKAKKAQEDVEILQPESHGDMWGRPWWERNQDGAWDHNPRQRPVWREVNDSGVMVRYVPDAETGGMKRAGIGSGNQ